MHAEPDVQMQQFADAVYGQNSTIGAAALSELAKIESRSVSFSRWKNTVEQSGQTPEVPERLLRHWVDADAASFRMLDSEVDVEIAADNIASNYQAYDEYCKEMQQLAGDVAKRVDALSEASRRRGVEQDRVHAKDLVARLRESETQRQMSKNTDLVDGFAAGGPALNSKPLDPAVVSRVLDSITYRAQADGSVLYLIGDLPAFTDHGRHIEVEKTALDDEQAILAAVLLAKEKYGGAFSLTGSEGFKHLALEVIAKHNVLVKLKSPAQEMMLTEIGAAYPAFANRPVPPVVSSTEDSSSVSTEAEPLPARPAQGSGPVDEFPRPDSADNELLSQHSHPGDLRILRPVSAHEWWTAQIKLINECFEDESARIELITQLGPEPSPGFIHWFDRAGNFVNSPHIDELLAYEASLATGSERFERELQTRTVEPSDGEQDVRDVTVNTFINTNGGELAMTEQESNSPVLRGIARNSEGQFDTTVLLFKGKGDYLQGFIMQDGVKHQVLAHINERKADPNTGEIKPNFLKLSKPEGAGDDVTWTELGFGNALNKRNDDKPVFFDEVLFNINGKTISARLGKDVDEELHAKLGFTGARVERPATTNTDRDVGPKMQAPGPKDAEVSPVAPTNAAERPKLRSSGARN